MNSIYQKGTLLLAIAAFSFSLNAQNVGIGSANPAQKLEVNEAGNVFIRVNTNTNSDAGIEFYRPGTGNRDWRLVNDGGTNFRFQHTLDLGVTALADIMVLDGPGDDVEILTGSLGIGTAVPGARLDVRGSAIFNEDSGNNDFRIESNNRMHAVWVDASTDIVFFGSSAATPTDNGATVAGSTVQYVADFDLGGAIWDGTTIGIGSIEYILDGVNETMINNAFASTTHLLDNLGNSTRAWDNVYADDFVNISDRREKNNIKDLTYGLKEVLQMRPVSYLLNKDPFGDTKLGLIAQEALVLVPEAVHTHDNKALDETKPNDYVKVELDRMGMKYTQLIPVLIKAIQEQQAQIEELKEEIETMKK